MIYIVTEDNTSALSFWKEFMKRSKEPYEFVLETLMNNGELKLGGNWTLKAQIKYVTKHIKAKDTLFIAFDTMSLKGTYKPVKSKSNTKNTENKFNPGDIIRMGNNLCKGKGCKFIYTLYYCFEEMFLKRNEWYNSERCNNCAYKYKNCSNDTKVTSIASSKCKNCIDYIK